jgi:uncharacterized delta-60 repeat protein
MTFGVTGEAVYNGSTTSSGKAVTVESSGKIVVAGTIDIPPFYSGLTIWRYDVNGVPDLTFGTTEGKVVYKASEYSMLNSIILGASGKILTVGTINGNPSKMIILAYDSNGNPAAFGSAGKVIGEDNSEGKDITVSALGKILVAGGAYNGLNEDIAIWAFDASGNKDSTFGAGSGEVVYDGGTYECASAIAAAGGRIYVAGVSGTSSTGGTPLVMCFNENGSPETGFGLDGKVLITEPENGYVYDVLVDPFGKILVLGRLLVDPSNGTIIIWRFNSDGSLDNSFGPGHNGKIELGLNNEIAVAMGLDQDGKILLTGNTAYDITGHMAIWRFNSDGTMDNNFGANHDGKTLAEKINTFGYSIGLAPSGKIIVVGTDYSLGGQMAIWRYLK